MPDAGRTREPCVQKNVHFAHASNDRAAGTPGIPCAMVLTAAPRSPWCAGLVSHHRLAIISQSLTPASGGQDHTAWPSARNAFVGVLNAR
jgi:hypothetical protein